MITIDASTVQFDMKRRRYVLLDSNDTVVDLLERLSSYYYPRCKADAVANFLDRHAQEKDHDTDKRTDQRNARSC